MWKEFINGYSISDNGDVRNDKTGRILKLDVNNRGFYRVTIKKRHYYIHKLMAQMFIPNRKKLPNVIFKDLDKENISLENLQWADNIINYTQEFLIERRIKNQKIDDRMKRMILHKPYMDVKHLAWRYNISISSIYKIRKNIPPEM